MAKQRASKDKRQAKNRARNAARVARAEVARDRSQAQPQRSSGTDGGAPRRGFFSRLMKPEPRTPTASSGKADRPAPIRGRPEGPMPRNDKGQAPGHRAALFALFFSVASVGLLLFIPIPIDREIDSPADAEPGCEIETTTTTEAPADADPVQLTCRDSVTIPGELGLIAFPILLLPIAITGIGFWATTRDRQSRIWTFCLLGLAAFLVVFSIGGLLFVPSMVALTVASFQSRRAEQQLLMAQRAAGMGRADAIDTTADDPGEPDDATDDRPPPRRLMSRRSKAAAPTEDLDDSES